MPSGFEMLDPPVVAKTARWGYDGKGQLRIEDATELESAWETLGARPLVLETFVEFERELSEIVARSSTGEIVDHGVMENDHVDHLLDRTVVPARVEPDMAEAATAMARSVVDALDVVGVMAVEMFQLGSGLVVNEIAPRPHNSGHCTIDAAPVSQFEQQLRAITGLPLGDGRCRPAAMFQLLGDLWTDGEPDWEGALSDPGVRLHLYGKAEHRPGRKMGHITCVAEKVEDAVRRGSAARDRLTTR